MSPKSISKQSFKKIIQPLVIIVLLFGFIAYLLSGIPTNVCQEEVEFSEQAAIFE